jgi:TolB-like protein
LNVILCHKKLLILLLCAICMPGMALAQPVKVAILPFAMHAEKDYGFLQKGIVEMLTSRLSAPGKVTVVDQVSTAQAVASAEGLGGESLALLVGAKLQADYAIHGSSPFWARASASTRPCSM